MEANPFHQFEKWFNIAKETEKGVEPNQMNLSTIGLDGYPDSRMVLMKEVKDGSFIFFTNYGSQKGQEIEQNNKVALMFYWPSKYWAVRIQGDATKTSADESDAYFKSRPIASQATAIVSHQSHVIADDKQEFVRKALPRPKASKI